MERNKVIEREKYHRSGGKCKDCQYWCKTCYDINNSRGKAGKGVPAHTVGESLCWCCKKAIPRVDPETGEKYGCSWSMRRRPVPGWKATKCTMPYMDGRDTISYDVEACPEFERG